MEGGIILTSITFFWGGGKPVEDMLLVITPPERLTRLGRMAIPAHPVYRVGNGRLFRMGQCNPRSGAMAVEIRGLGGGNLQNVCRQIVHECVARGFCGVVCTGTASWEFVATLDEVLAARGIALYVPEHLGEYTKQARVLIGSALSGGSLTCRLEEAAVKFGGVKRLALWVERSAEDFFLPAPEGSGKPLTGQELSALMKRLKPAVFFSDELCARYFTYMTREGGAHFVLFDDGATIRKKLQKARRLGIERAVALFEQVEDLFET